MKNLQAYMEKLIFSQLLLFFLPELDPSVQKKEVYEHFSWPQVMH